MAQNEDGAGNGGVSRGAQRANEHGSTYADLPDFNVYWAGAISCARLGCTHSESSKE